MRTALTVALMALYGAVCAAAVATVAVLGAGVAVSVFALSIVIGAGLAVCEAWWYVWNTLGDTWLDKWWRGKK